MDRTQRTEIVNMCMIYSGEFILVQDKVNAEWGGLTFPGGHVEAAESLTDAVIREVFEETGLTVVSPEYRAVVTFNSDTYPAEVMHLFTAKEFSGTLTDCSEGELAWILKSEVYSLPLWEGDKIFLNLISRDVPFFELDLEYESDKLVGAFLNGEELDV